MRKLDEEHCRKVAAKFRHTKLNSLIGSEEVINHVSTVFYTPELAIKVGHKASNPALLRQWDILIGVTPKFPIHNSNASEQENDKYVTDFAALLRQHRIKYLPARGVARDFPESGDGCFLLINVNKDEVMHLLKRTQLSFTYLEREGVGELISCVEV